MGKPRILLALLALGQVTCNQAILTAPAGSTLSIFANPNTISSNGGISVISVLVVEPAGTVVPDGTVVQFFTTLGDIDEQGKTNDGVARINLRANGRSGLANITAVSGGDAVPGPSPSPTPTASTTSGVAAAASSIGPAASASAGTTVTIGNFGATSVIVTADPPQITTPRGATQIRANVTDAGGNPLAGVPVFFSVSVSANGAAVLDSGGVPQFTDSNGQAFDVLHARSTVVGTSTATVQARVPNGTATTLSATVDVPIVVS